MHFDCRIANKLLIKWTPCFAIYCGCGTCKFWKLWVDKRSNMIWIDGWMDEYMDGWMDIWMDGWMNELMEFKRSWFKIILFFFPTNLFRLWQFSICHPHAMWQVQIQMETVYGNYCNTMGLTNQVGCFASILFWGVSTIVYEYAYLVEDRFFFTAIVTIFCSHLIFKLSHYMYVPKEWVANWKLSPTKQICWEEDENVLNHFHFNFIESFNTV